MSASSNTPDGRFARHMRSDCHDLLWHHRLGQLALACCPRGTPNRTRRLTALAEANPPCSLSLLHKVSKFAEEYTRNQVLDLARAGLGWDRLATLQSVPEELRGTAVDEVIRRGLTSREVRDWKAEEYGVRPPRGRQVPCPLSGRSPAVQARALANDCRRLAVRHGVTPDVLDRVRRNLDSGVPPTLEELALMQSAAGAVGPLLAQLDGLHSLLLQITAPCDEPPNSTGAGT